MGVFRKLPPEIRNVIYREYFAVDGGYIYNFTSGKLRAANGQPIDFSLMFTCTLIGQEMSSGSAFEANAVTFKTVCSAFHRNISPGRFDFLLNEVHQAQNSMLIHSISPVHPLFADFDHVNGRSTIDETMYRELVLKQPLFEPYWRALRNLQHWRMREICSPFDAKRYDEDRLQYPGFHASYCGSNSYLTDLTCAYRDWGEVPSVKRQAIHDAVKLLLERNKWPGQACMRLNKISTSTACAAVAHSLEEKYPPWTIPTLETCREIFNAINPHRSGQPDTGGRYAWDFARSTHWSDEGKPEIFRYSTSRAKFYISAASSAISFLTNSSDCLRKQIRWIILDEDHVAVGKPECHGLGLIRFCQQNLNLRIERRARLWTNVFQCDPCKYSNPQFLYQEAARLSQGLQTYKVTRRIALWATEARALGAAGMPPGSFSLVFDGGLWPCKAAEIFQNRIQRDVAWQLAFEESLKLGLLPEMPYLDKRRCVMYISEDFPSAVKDIMDDASNVRCNFDVGEAWDPWKIQQLVLQNKDFSLHKWMQRWHEEGAEFSPPNSPYGYWAKLLESGFLPWPYGDRPYQTLPRLPLGIRPSHRVHYGSTDPRGE